jgi:prepilin-type N-terminal cleavage/methylation domain-containing protein
MINAMNKGGRRRGMSLVELMIVVGVLGVIFAAVFLFFTKGMQQFHFSRRQNELATAGRLALEQITDEVIWAGYLPYGGIPADQWHPIHETEPHQFTFYADFHAPFGQLDDTKYRSIFLGPENTVLITDKGSMQRRVGYNVSSIQFVYIDQGGNILEQPLSLADRDAVRHIRVTLVLQDSYMGNVYSTTMRTTISPRNLGVNRNIDPSFIPNPPLSGIVVMNVDGSPGNYQPTADQYNMIHTLIYWGLTVVSLSDEELHDYDYIDNDISLVILRDIDGPDYHSFNPTPLQAIPCPVICLDPDDAAYLYGMGVSSPGTVGFHRAEKVVLDHGIHTTPKSIPGFDPTESVFQVYNDDDLHRFNYLTDVGAETEMITTIYDFGTVPALVAARDQELHTRRVFYGVPAATKYTQDGLDFFHNVISWTLGGGSGGDPGDPITAMEDFEGTSSSATQVVLWADDLNNPELRNDSLPLFHDDFSGGGKGLSWTLVSLGQGEVLLADETLRMHRPLFGGETRNIAHVSLPLGAYSILNDDLYLRVSALNGQNEFIGVNDGVFLVDLEDNIHSLYTQNFNSAPYSGYSEWVDANGRIRIHNPSGWQGDGNFVTMDSRINSLAQTRIMLQVPTASLPENCQFVVDYRFHDHNDQNHAYNAGTGTGDYLGWNSHGNITGSVNLVTNLNPAGYNNSLWHQRSEAFVISGVPPDPLYLVFAQYDNRPASSFTGNRGISLDNIHVTAISPDTTYFKIGTPPSLPGWNTLHIDLNAAALAHGLTFDDAFEILLSQSGTGPWDTYGISWDDFEVGIALNRLGVAGWVHEPIGGMVDDWSVRQNPTDPFDYMWALHAHDPYNSYSNGAHCYLETPEFLVPLNAEDPVLSFRSAFDFEDNYDFGYVQVSIGGGVWVDLGLESGLSYSHFIGGRHVFSGLRGWGMEEIDLTPYIGNSVRFRFVFFSDQSVVREGWYLDDFLATCYIEGHEISSIDFRTDWCSDMIFDHVDVYMGSTELTSFTGGGEWNKAELFHAYSGPLTLSGSQEWQSIPLDDSYFLPSGSNLIVKIESENTAIGSGSFLHEERENVCRAAQRDDTDPSQLFMQSTRPVTRFTVGGTPVIVDEEGGNTSSVVPLSFIHVFGDFEAIYTATELGIGSGVSWTSGGQNNDWEIGQPLFFPDIDPPLLPENGNNIAGTDLTVDGEYSPQAWSWLASSGYPMVEAAAYDTVKVRFFRCLRLASNDVAYVQMAFDHDPERNPEELSWINVREYNGVRHPMWQYETLNLTSVFNDNSSYDYYFIRFVLSSGLWLEGGGWNLDNIQFFGRTEGGK